jgi:hypothetical protein
MHSFRRRDVLSGVCARNDDVALWRPRGVNVAQRQSRTNALCCTVQSRKQANKSTCNSSGLREHRQPPTANCRTKSSLVALSFYCSRRTRRCSQTTSALSVCDAVKVCFASFRRLLPVPAFDYAYALLTLNRHWIAFRVPSSLSFVDWVGGAPHVASNVSALVERLI